MLRESDDIYSENLFLVFLPLPTDPTINVLELDSSIVTTMDNNTRVTGKA